MRTPSCQRGAPLRPLRSRWNYQVWNSFRTLENVFQTSHSRYERWMAFEQKLNQFSLNWKSLRSLTVDWISFLLSGQGPIVGSGTWTIFLKTCLLYFGWNTFCFHSCYEGLVMQVINITNCLRPAWLFGCDWRLCDCNSHLGSYWLQNEFLFWLRGGRHLLQRRMIAFASHPTKKSGLVSIFSSHHHIHNSRPGVFNLKQISPCTTSGMYNTLKTKFKIFCIF